MDEDQGAAAAGFPIVGIGASAGGLVDYELPPAEMPAQLIAYATRLYGWSEAEALALNVRKRIPPELREEALAKLQQLSRAKILAPYRTQRLAKDGAVVNVWMTATALMNETGQSYAIATTERGGG